MPSLGADMTHGRLLEWRVRPGDPVQRGDIVALVDTEKAAIEVEVFEDGVVEALLVAEGERVPVGTALARLQPAAGGGAGAPPPSRELEAERAGEVLGAAGAGPAPAAGAPQAAAGRAAAGVPPAAAERPAAGAGVPPAAAAPAAPAAPPAARVPPPATPARATPAPAAGAAPAAAPAALPLSHVRASPAARVLASEEGIDLAQLIGTGPGGAILRADVERAAAVAGAAPEEHPRRVSALAREVAVERGVDLEDVLGTGPGGAVTRADVERAADRMAAAERIAASERMAAPERVAGLEDEEAARRQAMRRAIAAAVTRSNREIPHYWVSSRIDMSRALERMAAENLKRPVASRLLPAALLLRAVALSLREHPELNGFWEDGAFRAGDGVHLGVAISLRGGGLIAPAIRSADALTLDETMAALSDLVRRARSGGLRGSELTSATITVTNLGERGADEVFGVIYPPQVALVGFGRITEQPWAEDGMLGIRPVVTATLAADHRATDGHLGSLFLVEIGRRLLTPEEL
jgi:pyruvate dehydrogenase E2 component (dihydrolipoamide acetyltransferase)